MGYNVHEWIILYVYFSIFQNSIQYQQISDHMWPCHQENGSKSRSWHTQKTMTTLPVQSRALWYFRHRISPSHLGIPQIRKRKTVDKLCRHRAQITYISGRQAMLDRLLKKINIVFHSKDAQLCSNYPANSRRERSRHGNGTTWSANTK